MQVSHVEILLRIFLTETKSTPAAARRAQVPRGRVCAVRAPAVNDRRGPHVSGESKMGKGGFYSAGLGIELATARAGRTGAVSQGSGIVLLFTKEAFCF